MRGGNAEDVLLCLSLSLLARKYAGPCNSFGLVPSMGNRALANKKEGPDRLWSLLFYAYFSLWVGIRSAGPLAARYIKFIAGVVFGEERQTQAIKGYDTQFPRSCW